MAREVVFCGTDRKNGHIGVHHEACLFLKMVPIEVVISDGKRGPEQDKNQDES